MIESSKKAAPWRQDVKLDSHRQFQGPVFAGPVSVSIVFWLPRPKAHFRTGKFAGQLKPTAPTHCTSAQAGDIDKLIRCTLDGLSAKCGGIVLADDSLVVSLSSEKRYVTDDRATGADITVIER